MKPMIPLLGIAAFILLSHPKAQAQHLWWNLEGQKDATCAYGEITVLATHPNIYYCGVTWHPGEPAGGYCGIQHNGGTERRTIFSIWDTSPTLHPTVTYADPKTEHNRFGGEGTGGHTHMLWAWKVGETFHFFVRKRPGKEPDTTDTQYFIYDPRPGAWLHVATITNPNGGFKSVSTIGGGMNSFLENFAGKDREAPKLALYRLWIGPSANKLKCLTRSGGDATWGELGDAYFLAEGYPAQLNAVFTRWEPEYGKPVFGVKGAKLPPVTDRPAPQALIAALPK